MNQHIDNYENHSKNSNNIIQIEKKTRLYEILNSNDTINGFCNHHQAIEVLAKNMKINSYDKDGNVHGIELNDQERWVVGVQWFHFIIIIIFK